MSVAGRMWKRAADACADQASDHLEGGSCCDQLWVDARCRECSAVVLRDSGQVEQHEVAVLEISERHGRPVCERVCLGYENVGEHFEEGLIVDSWGWGLRRGR